MTDEGSDNNKKVVVHLGQRLCSDGKRLENGVLRVEERALLDTGGSRVNEIGGGGQEINGMAHSAGSGQVPPPSQQPSQGTTVCWERFLHLRSLRVLLVENDDCTRHVVAALLRNCSYEVVEASNGIQAWRILEDITNHIDLVLTEVVLPCFMGISLLCKIMSHKSRNNVPVIMMSPHDSMGLVFKCLSKGAVDFLVKPIRKNELKNLWQHVWRRCHSSSGSGSESGTHSQKSVKSRSVNKSDNNSCSNDEQESESPPLNFGDGSDHGSGTQSSWTKQVVEDIESPRPATLLDDIAECPESTRAQFIHASALPPANMASVAAPKEGQEVKETPGTAGTGQALEVSAVKKSDLQQKFPDEVRPELTSLNPSGMPKIEGSNTVNDQIYKGAVESNAENAYGEPNGRTLKVTGSMPGYSDSPTERKGFDAANKISKISEDINDNSINESQERPSMGQSLKRLRGLQDAGKTKQEEINVLRCSKSSAFSRYNAVLQNKISRVDARSPSPLEKQLDGRREMLNMQSCCSSNSPNQFSVGGGVHVDVTSFSNNEYAEKVVAKNRSVETPTIHNLHPGSVIQPGKKGALCFPQQATLEDRSAVTPAKMFVQPEITSQELKILHLHPFNSLQLPVCKVQPLPPNHDNLPLKNMAASTVHYGSSDIVGGHVEGNAANYSMNGSGSGSNHGSNLGSSTAANAGGMNTERNNGVGGKGGDASGSGNGSGGGSGSGSGGGSGSRDKSWLAQREATLTKFRQKRKERCFNRKVRYQGRKKLAEQRPRVRGQFVRQMPQENGSNTSKDTGS